MILGRGRVVELLEEGVERGGVARSEDDVKA
jgi:hypothetical protein